MQAAMVHGPAAHELPDWLRPTAYAVVTLVHVIVVLGFAWPRSPDAAAPMPLQISVVSQGAPAPSPAAQQGQPLSEVKPVEGQLSDVKPEEVQAVEVTTTADPVAKDRTEVTEAKPVEQPHPTPPAADLAAVQPTEQPATALNPIETPRATEPLAAIPPVEPRQRPTPSERLKPQPTPAEAQQKRRKAEEAAERKKKADARKKSAAARASSSGAQSAARSGALSARGPSGAVTGSVATANYRSLVMAELNRHKRYPDSARSSGVEGVVVVSFTIGSSGRVTGHSITRSSGNGALDASVHAMMSAMSLPPPPGGVFRASAPVRFTIAR